ncbi:MAG: hypothetical protein ABL889_04670 [Terricaulis sp.]
MSYYTKVQLAFLGDETIDFEAIQPALARALAERHFSEDVLQDLAELFADGECSLGLFALDIAELMLEAARASADAAFSVRGWGEAPRDVWLRDYENGEEIFALGPPENAI